MKRILILLILVFCFINVSVAGVIHINEPIVLGYGTSLAGITFNPGDSIVLFTLPTSGFNFAWVNCTNAIDPGFLSDFKIYFPNVCDNDGFCPQPFYVLTKPVPITGPGDIILKNVGTSSHTFDPSVKAYCTVEVF